MLRDSMARHDDSEKIEMHGLSQHASWDVVVRGVLASRGMYRNNNTCMHPSG